MSKGGGREPDDTERTGVIDTAEFAVGGGEDVGGREALREDRRLGSVEPDDGEAVTVGKLAGDGPEHAALRGGHDHRRLHLEDRAGDGEAQGAGALGGDHADATDFPGVEGGERDSMDLLDEEHQSRVATNRVVFEHRGVGQVTDAVFASFRTMPMKYAPRLRRRSSAGTSRARSRARSSSSCGCSRVRRR